VGLITLLERIGHRPWWKAWPSMRTPHFELPHHVESRTKTTFLARSAPVVTPRAVCGKP
jgi:hypothetical protein